MATILSPPVIWYQFGLYKSFNLKSKLNNKNRELQGKFKLECLLKNFKIKSSNEKNSDFVL